MAFQIWEISGGQHGEGVTVDDAVAQALAAAVLQNNVTVRDLPYEVGNPEVPNTYDMTADAIRSMRWREAGFCVLNNHVGLYVEQTVARRPEPEVTMMPVDAPSVAIYDGGVEGDAAFAIVYGLVRHVESTPAYTDMLAKQSV